MEDSSLERELAANTSSQRDEKTEISNEKRKSINDKFSTTLTVFQKVAAATWRFSKATVINLNDRRKRAIAERNARLAEKRRQAQIASFKAVYAQLNKNKSVINPSSWEKIEQYENAVSGDPAALHAFAESRLIKNLVNYGEARSEFHSLDRARSSSTFSYEVSADDLFSVIGYSQIDPVLRSIAAKYKISNAGNTVAGAIMAGRKNYGGAALAMADSARVGAHNGAAATAFTDHLKYLVFAKFSSDMIDTQRRYLRYAYRLLFTNTGDKAATIRAIFSLIYSNNNCSVRPPSPPNKFSSNLYPEFHNNFRHLIWTVHEAIAHLETERQKGGVRATLYSDEDVTGVLKSWEDVVPAPGFHLVSQ